MANTSVYPSLLLRMQEAVEHVLAQDRSLVVTSSPVDVSQVLNRCKEEATVEEQEMKEKTLTVWQLASCYLTLSKSRLSGLFHYRYSTLPTVTLTGVLQY